MRTRPLAALAWLALTGLAAVARPDDTPAAGPRPVDPAAVAKQPAPGSTVPGNFAFTPDGKALTYLKSESDSLDRVLWKVDLNGGDPRVIARPPGGGDTDASVSREEALRRERQRLRDTGITQVIRAKTADVAVVPLGGDLYLLRGESKLERLTETPAPEIDPQLTDDGSKVAFVREGDLYVLDLASKGETRLTEGATDGLTHGLAEFMAQEEMNRFTGFWWSPDGARIAYQETDERHIPPFSIVHQGGEDLAVETHRYPFPGADNAKVRLGLIDAKGGATLWLELSEDGGEVYLARVDWESPRSLLVQVLTRDQKTLRLVRFDAESGRGTTLFEESAPTWINLHNDLRVLESTGEILWTTEKSGFRHLELRGKDGKVVRELTSGDWPVDAVVGVDEKRREAWFTAGRESPLETHLYRVGLDDGQVTRVTAETGTHKPTVAPDGERFVDVHSSVGRPPVTTLRDREGKVVATLADASEDPRLLEFRLSPPQLVEFKSRDGVKLYGAYYARQGKALGLRARAPLVVMLYGGPHVQYVANQWSMTSDLTAQMLAERGFAVWKMDNRGAARRGHAFEAALNRDMGRIEVQDQVDGVKHVTSAHPEVDAERVGVTGGSYGGYMTLRCLELAPDVFKAGVALAPVTDWDGYDTTYTERYMGTPLNNPQGYSAASVLGQVEKIRGPLLLVHGLLDENVHFRHTARLIEKLSEGGKTYELLLLPAERHSTRKESDRKYVASRLAEFFERTLAQR